MIKNKCNHEWEKNTDASRELGAGSIDATFACKKCRALLSASDVFQLETLLEIRSWQRWLSVGAITIAFVSLIISIISLLKK